MLIIVNVLINLRYQFITYVKVSAPLVGTYKKDCLLYQKWICSTSAKSHSPWAHSLICDLRVSYGRTNKNMLAHLVFMKMSNVI